MLKTIIFLPALVIAFSNYGQKIMAAEIEVDDMDYITFDVESVEKMRVYDGGVKVYGELGVDGHADVLGRIYFGGSKKNSFIQNVDGGTGASSYHEFNLSVESRSILNIEVNLGGRVGSTQVGGNWKIHGNMESNSAGGWQENGTSGYMDIRPMHSWGGLRLQMRFINSSTLGFRVINPHSVHYLLYAGHLVVSQNGWGFP